MSNVVRRCVCCSGTCGAGALRVGMRIGGRPVKGIQQRTVFGVVLVDWQFGCAETTDVVHKVTARMST